MSAPTFAPEPYVSDVLLAYRDALLEWWRLGVEVQQPSAAEVISRIERVVTLARKVGEPRATTLREAYRREWARETGYCPTCGESGPLHEGHPPSE